MAAHRYIATSFWQDDWIQSLDPSERYMYLYLMTNPLTNIAGIYKIGNRQISFDTGYNQDTVMAIIEKFAKNGKAYRMGEYIVLPSWPKHQNWQSKENIYTGIVKELDKLADDELRYVYLSGYKFPMDDILAQRGVEPPTNTPPTMVGANYSILLHINLSNINLSKPEIAEASPPAVENPLPVPKPQKHADKPKKPPLQEREPENDYERVEKAYLRNWADLYSQGKVKTENPVANWTQTRALLKKHFERLKPGDITGALNRGMNDNFIMQGGYSLAVMLSATVLNRLINTSGGASGAGPPPSLQEKKSLRGLNQW